MSNSSHLNELLSDLATSLKYNYATDDSLIPIASYLLGRPHNSELTKLCVDCLIEGVDKFNLNYTSNSYLNSKYNISTQYLISKFANISRNIIVTAAILKILKNSDYRKRELKIHLNLLKDFLKKEINFIKKQPLLSKTIGYEMVMARYYLFIFPSLDFYILKLIFYATRRVLKFSKTLLFNIESLPHIYVWYIKKLLRRNYGRIYNQNSYLNNSGQLSLYFIEELSDTEQRSILEYISVNRGFPLFFKSEIFELALIADVLDVLGLDTGIVDNLLKEFDILSAFDKNKGFSISRHFSMTDADTTGLMLKILLKHFNDYSSTLKEYDFTYYKSKDNGLYKTYYKDNRKSITTNSHILDFFNVANLPNKQLYKSLIKEIHNSDLYDKWNISKIYVLFTIIGALKSYSAFEISEDLKTELEYIFSRLMSYKKNDNGFSSIADSTEGNLYESSWAYLCLLNLNSIMTKYDLSLSSEIAELRKYIMFIKSKREERLKFWLLNDTYSLVHIDNLIYNIPRIL